VKTVVIDTNELARDMMLNGLKYKLFEHMQHATWLDVRIPALVLEELVASHSRALGTAQRRLTSLEGEFAKVGHKIGSETSSIADYRTYVETRFEERLGFAVMPWPTVPHQDLVGRATSRTPPFDANGGGYRDALIWADVLQLAREGHDVVLVSFDKAFKGEDDALHPALQAEAAESNGSITLVRDFSPWLLSELPWAPVPDLASAVSTGRTKELWQYIASSDFLDDLDPSEEDMGFPWRAREFKVMEVEWNGTCAPLDKSSRKSGLSTLVEYELGFAVSFSALFADNVDLQPQWRTTGGDIYGWVPVEGVVDMQMRLAVLYDDELGWGFDQLSWRPGSYDESFDGHF
jgi:hypothetical protein